MEGSAFALSLPPRRLPVAPSASGASFGVPQGQFWFAKMTKAAVAPQTSRLRWLQGKAAEGDRRDPARTTPQRRMPLPKPVARLLPIVVAAMLCGPAMANDTAAELATGGIVLKKNADIEMLSERLHISSQQIRVRYSFYNTSRKEVTILIAFPMPDITIEDSAKNISIPTHHPENLLGFSTFVNNKPITARVEQKVFARGVDRTADLHRLKIPLAPHSHATTKALNRLSQSARDELVKLGLADVETHEFGKDAETQLLPRWTLKTTYYWKETFPAQTEVIVQHRYKPSIGWSSQTSLGDPAATDEDWFSEYQRKYCLARDLVASVERARRVEKVMGGAPYSEERISYLLSTAANWSRPIQDFLLIVDKGDRSNLLSFCAEGTRKISPTQFEVHKTNFVPDSDLHILILRRFRSH
jgi:hypothetical protein